MKNLQIRAAAVIILVIVALTVAYGVTADIAALVASGSVSGDVYSNNYLGIRVSAPDAKLTSPSMVNLAGRRARLLNAVYDSPLAANNYTLGLMADSRANYPPNMDVSVYVRSVRHALEKSGNITHLEEFPVTIAGRPFTGAVLKVPTAPNAGYYKGIYTTDLNGYLVSIEVQCSDQNRLQQLLSSSVTITR